MKNIITKKFFRKFLTMSSCLLLLILSNGCLRWSKNGRSIFNGNSSPNLVFEQEQDGVLLTVEALNDISAKSMFGVNLVSKGYVPIRCTVHNETPNELIIRPSYINLICSPPEPIAKLLRWDTSLFVSVCGYMSVLFWWPGLYFTGRTGYSMRQANLQMNAFVDQSTIEKQTITILPYDTIEKFIFVSVEDFRSLFLFRIFDTYRRQILDYNVCLNPVLSKR